jgi:hypothetical protein
MKLIVDLISVLDGEDIKLILYLILPFFLYFLLISASSRKDRWRG